MDEISRVSTLAAARDYANRHPGLFSSFTVVLVLSMIVWMLFGQKIPFGGSDSSPQAWFISEDSNKEIKLPADTLPPVARDGVTYVRAFYFSSSGTDQRVLGYLQKLSPEARAAEMTRRQSQNGSVLPLPHAGILIRTPVVGSPWVDADSAEGHAVTRNLHSTDGRPLREIRPD